MFVLTEGKNWVTMKMYNQNKKERFIGAVDLVAAPLWALLPQGENLSQHGHHHPLMIHRTGSQVCFSFPVVFDQ